MPKKETFDCQGWVTKYNIRCGDGRTIRSGAFKDCDGQTVPVVWSHQHNSPEYVLGHALLEHRDEGVWGYISLNDTKLGKDSKELVRHRDIGSFSIYANKLKQDDSMNVYHGMIREVSLVLAGANPKALIDYSFAHSDEVDDDELAAAVFIRDSEITFNDDLEHSETEEAPKTEESDKEITEENNQNESIEHAEGEEKMPNEEKTLAEIFDTLNDEQKEMVYALVGLAKSENNTEEDSKMKHNAFENENEETQEYVLSHSDIEEIFADAQTCGSLKKAVGNFALAHSVTNISNLFPDNKLVEGPRTVGRDVDWVEKFMGGVHKTPFSRIKSMYFNITADEARAKGYDTKGEQKLEEVIVALKRTTDPTTIYKLQKLDRDDVVDITDFDIVAYIKQEMRGLLREEAARAALLGDGRSSSAPDKINETHIRPIYGDDNVYTIRTAVDVDENTTETARLKGIIRAVVKARKNYKGSGNPIMFTTEDVLTDLLLMEDLNGHVIYDTAEKLAKAMRVSDIVTVPVMEGRTRTGTGTDAGYTFTLDAIVVNPKDYTVGMNKLGDATMFDDFDLNYNKYEYLIETRMSGALTVPYSAIIVEEKKANEVTEA